MNIYGKVFIIFVNYNYNFEHIFLEYIAIQDHMDEIYKDHG
jgi:hypothetical protein